MRVPAVTFHVATHLLNFRSRAVDDGGLGRSRSSSRGRGSVATAKVSARVDDPNPEPPMQSGAVDTHCHLFLLDGDPAEAVENARNAGVSTPSSASVSTSRSSRRSIELATSLPGVAATAGMHPHDASAFDAEAEEPRSSSCSRTRSWSRSASAVWTSSACGRPARIRSARSAPQVALAKAYDLPLVIHVRDAWPEILRVLDEGSAERVVLALLQRRRRDRGGVRAARLVPLVRRERHLPEERAPAQAAASRCRSTGSSSRPTARSSRHSGCVVATTRRRTSST